MKNKKIIYILYSLPLPVLFISLFIGPSESIQIKEILAWLLNTLFKSNSFNSPKANLIQAIIIDVRLPRILLTFLVGAALTTSGSALQAIFRNPLVSPYILGLSSGAAFGAAIGLTLAFIPVQLSAFAFGILAVGFSYLLARQNKSVSVVTLILSGVVVTGIFTALLTIIQFISDPFKLQTIVHWTMGNLHNSNWTKLNSSAWMILAGIIILFIFRWRLNVLALGDEETRAVGLNPGREKLFVLIPATLAASAAVSVAGVIGLIGLITPHMVRMMVGPDNQRSMPVNFLFGGSFLLIIDNFSRTLTDFEIPIGVFTMLIGAPFFIFLIKRSKIGWEN